MEYIKGYKFRLYPNKTQKKLLNKNLGSCLFCGTNHDRDLNAAINILHKAPEIKNSI